MCGEATVLKEDAVYILLTTAIHIVILLIKILLVYQVSINLFVKDGFYQIQLFMKIKVKIYSNGPATM